MSEHTIPDITLFNLPQNFGPDIRMTGFVRLDGGGFDVDYLGDSAGWAHFAGGNLFLDVGWFL